MGNESRTEFGLAGFEFQTLNSSLGRKREERLVVNQFTGKNCVTLCICYHLFCVWRGSWVSAHSRSEELLCLSGWGEGGTQVSLSLRVSDTEFWQFIWSTSQPGSQDSMDPCNLAQRTVCICVAWLSACVHSCKSCILCQEWLMADNSLWRLSSFSPSKGRGPRLQLEKGSQATLRSCQKK